MMQDNERQVKGIWIPIEIWKNPNLSWSERILFAEIDSLTSKDRDCCFSNEYIAELLGVSVYNASRALNHLIELGYVIKTRFDGRRRFIRSAFSYMKERDAGLPETASLPLQGLPDSAMQGCQKQQGSIAENSNIINNIIDKEINTKKESIEKEIDNKFSFIEEGWEEVFTDYLLYRRQIGKPLKPVSYKQSYNQLKKLADNDPSVAKLIVEQTIGNGWQGLFALKNNTSHNKSYERTDFNPRLHVPSRGEESSYSDDLPF